MSDDLNVKVDATTAPYEAAIARAQNATLRWDLQLKQVESDLGKLQKELDDQVTAALKRQHDAMDKTGRAAFVFGAGVATALGLAANEAVKWETAWTGVQKTVNGSAAELDQLEGQLRQLATTLPTTHEEIAAVAEAAGQLGVATPDIASFTKTMIDLGQTTNLSAEEAATSIAQLMNVMQSAPESVDRIGATLVALGNAGASTEADILALAQRLSGVGKLTGASEAEVLALASSMANLGIQAELGGGAMSRVITHMYADVHKGGDVLEKWAQLAGISADKFARKFATSPVQALNLVLGGMGRLKDGGGDLIGTLADLGLSGTQNMQVLLRLAGAGDSLTESLKTGNQAWKSNTALLNEANQRYGTTASQVAIARNELRDAAITMGDTLLPAIAAVAGFLGDLITTWQDLPGPVHDVILVLALAAAGIGLFGGAALMAIPKIAAFKVAVEGLEAGALKTAGTRLMGMGSLLTGPWGIAIAGGITALGYFAAKHGEVLQGIDEVTQTLDAQTGAVTENTRQWAIKSLQDQGALVWSSALGLNLQQVTDAALGNADAMAAVSAQLDSIPDGGLATQVAIDKVRESLGITNDTLGAAQGAWNLEQQAKGASTDATQKATEAQKGTTQAWQDGADAAGDLTEEAKTLGEQIAELSDAYLSQRDADRAVRGSLRDIRDAIKAYRKEHDGLKGAFKEGTKSGDDFAGMLDDLAKDYQKALEAAEKNGESQKQLKRDYNEAFDSIVAQAKAFGMSKDAAKAYAETVLGLPSDYQFSVGIHADEADRRLKAIQDKLNNIVSQDYIAHMTVITSNIHRGGSQVDVNENGSIKTYAGGGIDSAGGYVPRVSQIAQGGRTIMWAEPNTGWEAYISGKPGMEARNRDIWLEAGRRLGMAPAGQYGGRSYDSGGFAGGRGGGVTVIKQVLPGRFEFVVDDNSFTGYIRGHAADVARSEIDADASYSAGLERMD